MFIAVQRLDSVKAWEHNLGSSKEPPTWKQFSEFLITRLLSLQAFEKSRVGKNYSQGLAKSHFQGKDNNSSKPNSCTICSSNHYTAKCPQYSSKTVQQRLAIIKKHHLCYNCLGSHRSSACHNAKRCLKCGNKHHTTIHEERITKSSSESKTATESSVTGAGSSETRVLHSSTERRAVSSSVLLATGWPRVTVASHCGEAETHES